MIPFTLSFGTICLVVILLLLVWNLFRTVWLLFTSPCDIRASRARINHATYSSKVVWISEATTPIGRALIRAFVTRGAMLILSSTDEEALHKLPELLSCPTNNIHIYTPCKTLENLEEQTNPNQDPNPNPNPSFENILFSNEQLHQRIGAIFGRLDIVILQTWPQTLQEAQSSKIPVPHVSAERLSQAVFHAFTNPVTQIIPLLSKLSANPGVNGKLITILPICTILPTPHRSLLAATSAATASICNAVLTDDPHGPDIVNVYVGDIDETDPFQTDRSANNPHANRDRRANSKVSRTTFDLNKNEVSPDFTADRILAAASDRLDSVIIAPTKHLWRIRFRYWFPSLFETIYLHRPLFPISSRFYRLSAPFSTLVGQRWRSRY